MNDETLRSTYAAHLRANLSNEHRNAINKLVFSKLLFVPAAAILLAALVVALCAGNGNISRAECWGIQVDGFLYLNSVFSNSPEFWLNVTELGNGFILFPFLSFFLIIQSQTWAAFFGAIPVSMLLSNGGKALASMPRPAAVLDPQLMTIIGEPLNRLNSFPSGHTTTVFAAATVIVLMLLLKRRQFGLRWIVAGVIVAASMVAFSRIAVGAHWPLDVMVGAACGYLGGISGIAMTQRYTRWWHWIEKPNCQLVLGLLLFAWSGALIEQMRIGAFDALAITWTAAAIAATTSLYVLVRNTRRA